MKSIITQKLALDIIKTKKRILSGGFGLCGIPSTIIKIIASDKNIKDLDIVSNNAGTDNFGLGLLLKNRQINKLTCSYIGENKLLENQYLSGGIEVQLIPQV